MIMLSEMHTALRHGKTVPNSGMPIIPRAVDVPVTPCQRWTITGNNAVLTKTYVFSSFEMRSRFVVELFEHEEEVSHRATLDVFADVANVNVSLCTNGVGVTEIDKEYARFADALYRDLNYNQVK